jgi:alkylated DNA repair dioxygenase AlkB
LGAERIFRFRERNGSEKFDFTLENGSLIVMGDGCQDKYEHCLLKDEKITEGRINLTFRLFDYNRYKIFDKL